MNTLGRGRNPYPENRTLRVTGAAFSSASDHALDLNAGERGQCEPSVSGSRVMGPRPSLRLRSFNLTKVDFNRATSITRLSGVFPVCGRQKWPEYRQQKGSANQRGSGIELKVCKRSLVTGSIYMGLGMSKIRVNDETESLPQTHSQRSSRKLYGIRVVGGTE